MKAVKYSVFPLLLASCSLVGLSGCATPANSSEMTVRPALTETHYPDALNRAMCVRNVTGGESTNPLWISKVGNQDFHTALNGSMDAAGLSAPEEACKYQVDVNLLGLTQPSFGLNFKVTSNVNYKVYDPSGQPILLETISADYTATFSDSAIGVVRLKKANEGSIRANISKFFSKLQEVKVEQVAHAPS